MQEKEKNASMMFYLTANRYTPEVLKIKEAKTSLTEEKKDGNYNKEEWHKKLGLQSEIYINVFHRNSHIREKVLRIIYNTLRVKLTGALQVCDGYDIYKAKAHDFRNKTYTRASDPGESIFVDTNGTFPEILIGNRYWIDLVDNYSHYSCRSHQSSRTTRNILTLTCQ